MNTEKKEREKNNEKELTRGELFFQFDAIDNAGKYQEYDRQQRTCECDACYNCETKRSAIIPQAHSLLFAVFPSLTFIRLYSLEGAYRLLLQLQFSPLPPHNVPISHLHTNEQSHTLYMANISNTKSKNLLLFSPMQAILYAPSFD
jgi:hypothetical protein